MNLFNLIKYQKKKKNLIDKNIVPSYKENAYDETFLFSLFNNFNIPSFKICPKKSTYSNIIPDLIIEQLSEKKKICY
jgi:hypothetical protein